MVCKKKVLINASQILVHYFFFLRIIRLFSMQQTFSHFFFQTTKIKGYSFMLEKEFVFRRQVSRRNRHLVVGGAKIAKVGVALFIDQRPHP